MKRVWCLALVLSLLLVAPIACTLRAQSENSTAGEIAETSSRITQFCWMFAKYTGWSLHPVVGLAMIGGWTYFSTSHENRPLLPPYFRGWPLGLSIALALAYFAKSFPALALLPILKIPLNAAGAVTNILGAAILYVPMLHSLATEIRAMHGISAGFPALEVVAYAQDGSAAGAETPWLVVAVVVAFAAVAYWALWLLGNLSNALILVNPLPFLDIVLLAMVVGTMATLAIATWLQPLLGLALSLALIYFAIRIAGSTFRWTLFSTVFAWDVLTFREDRQWGNEGVLRAFSGPGLSDLPPRTMGRLKIATDGNHSFSYRSWTIGPTETVSLPTRALAMGVSLTYPCLIQRTDPDEEDQLLLHLAPRYREQEEAIARALRVPCCDIGWRRGLVAAWRWIKGQFSAPRPGQAPRSATS
jgi:hypothetical protein